MSARTDVINLIVNVNSNVAQNALNDLRLKAASTKLEMDALGKKTAEYAAKKKELDDIAKAMADLKKEIGLAALTQKELTSELSKLKALRGSVIPFSKEFHELGTEIERVEARLYDVRNGVQGFASWFSKISDSIKQFGVMAAGYLGFQFITSQFQSILSGAGKLSDQLADLRRVAGLTAEEAQILNTALGKIDTRTSVASLRDIAIVAGKLGIAKNDILDFVKATDMLVVALGDELGDSDAITTQLGKILNVFNGNVTGDAMAKLGNSIVVLANAGVATGGFISDFTQRVAGIAKASNLSLGATTGLAAGFEELGLRSESSATALQKLLSTIAADLPKAAKIAGATSVAEIQKYTDLFAKSPAEALIKYSEGLTKNKTSFSEITASFKEAGEEGARTVQTLQAIGQRGDFLRGKIDLGTQSIKDNSAITEAFDLKNQTLGATMDKLGKEFAKFASSGLLTSFLVGAVEGLLKFFQALKQLPKFINDNIIAILSLVAALIVYNAANIKSFYLIVQSTIAENARAFATKASAVVAGIAAAAQEAYAAILLAVTGRITIATAAQRLWAAAVSLGLGPISILIAAIGLLANALVKIYSETTKYTAALALQDQLSKAVSEDIGNQKQKIEQLASAAGNLNLSLETRKSVLAELIKQNPEYLSGLTLENITTQAGIDIINDYIGSLNRLAVAKNLRKIKDEADLEAQKKNLELPGLEIKKDESSFFNNIFNTGDIGKYVDAQADLHKTQETANAAQDQINKLTHKYTEDIDVQTKALQGLKVGTEAYATANRNLNASIKERNALAGITPELGTQVIAPVSAKGPSATTIESLKAKIKDLNTSYETIDITEKGLMRKNRDEKDKLQAQLDAIEGKKSKAEKKGESEYERTLKEAQKFAEEIRKLQLKVRAGDQEENQKEVELLGNKYAEFILKAEQFHTKLHTTDIAFKAQELQIELIHQEELLQLYEKQFIKKAALEYADSQKNSDELFAEERNKLGHKYADGLIDKKQYEAGLRDIETKETENRIQIAKDYAINVKKGAEDVKTFTKKQEDEITKNLVAEADKRLQFLQQESEAALSLSILNAHQNKNADLELELKKRELAAKFILETKGMEATSAMYKLAYANLNKDISELNNTAAVAKINKDVEVASTILSNVQSLATSIESIENNSVKRDAQNNDKKKRSMALQVKSKLISQQQYDLQSANMDLEQQTRERKAAREQAKINKAIAIVSAEINTATAVTAALGEQPWGPWAIAEAIAVGVLGEVQVAAIAMQPLPELGTGDWVRTGDKHSDASGGINAKIERDEAVISAAAMTDNNKYTITGTTAQITSKLNSKAGGVSWSPGAVIDMPQWRTAKPSSINTNMPRIMAAGGVAAAIPQQNIGNGQSVDLRELVTEIKGLREDVANQNTQLHAVVSIKEYRNQELKYDLAKKVSGMSQ